MPEQKYEWKSLRASKYGDGDVDVVGFVYADKHSVLAGQLLTCFINSYPSEEAARKEHPDVTGWVNKFTQPQVSLNHLPGEDDPVPGGMYPDDYPDTPCTPKP